MRRKRSETIEAESVEEFLRISIEGLSSPRYNSPKTDSIQSISPTSPYNRSESCPQLGPTYRESLEGGSPNSYWDDIDYQASPTFDARSLSETDTTICSSKSRSEDDSQPSLTKEKEEESSLKVIQTKVMVIGGKDTGKHTIIDSLFERSVKEKLKFQNAFDLVIKRQIKKDHLNLFKFWIKDADCHTFDQLIKVHYKTIKFYIFIYNTTDRKSFETIQAAIEQAKTEVPPDNFNGILIGNIRHQHSFLSSLLSPKKKKREVTLEEGEELRKKFGLSKFLEINAQSSEKRKEVLNFLLIKK